MTALSAAAPRDGRNLGAKRPYLMKASVTIYKGAAVMIDSNGLANPAGASASNLGCVGVATETVTSAASGSYYIEVQVGEYLFAADTLTQAAVNTVVFADDDNTADTTDTNTPKLGLCTQFVSATSVWVDVDPKYTHG